MNGTQSAFAVIQYHEAMVRRIIFIYNADSGPLAAALDSARKLAGPANACAPTAYYHRDDLPAAIRSFLNQRNLSLPIVLFEKENGSHELAVSADALKACRGEPLCLKREVEAGLKRAN